MVSGPDAPSPHGPKRFEMDDPAPARPREAVPAAPAEPRSPVAASPVRAPSPQPPAGEVEVDTRTFAEKHGHAVERVAGVRPFPPDWPREALRYPVRGAGLGLLAGTSGALFALDLLGWPESLRFLSWLIKTPALLFIVRWQLDLVGMSAAGRDEPVGWTRALAVDRQGLNGFLRYVGWFCISMLPFGVLFLLGPSALNVLAGTAALAVALLILGSAWFSVIALSTALEEPRLKRPWVTVAWLFQHPLACLVGSLGWWALAVTEVALSALARSGEGVTLPAAALLRVGSVYALMVSARVLGVLGRRHDPERLRPV